MKKKKATGSVGYMLLFGLALILVMVTLYEIEMAKLMTHQHDIDDALCDSVLASLVADDVYYFETFEGTGTAVVRFRDNDASFTYYKDSMSDVVANTNGFYHNFHFVDFIEYEVEGNTVTITSYSGDDGVKLVTTSSLGNVVAPTGEVVSVTSAYGKVVFDIKSILTGQYITKTRDLYCTLEIN